MLMTKRTVGFIGGGRVTRIFLEGWSRAECFPTRVVVSDPNAESLAKLKARFPAAQAPASPPPRSYHLEIADSNASAAAQDVVIVALHPPAIPEVLPAIKEHLKPGALVLSLAPKFTLANLAAMLGGFKRLARLIPNAASSINFGYNPVVLSPALTPEDRDLVTSLLTPLGECPEVPENQLEAYAVVTAMAPTFFWFQLQALREVALQLGLSEAEAVPALKRMICGSARTLFDSGFAPAEVMDLVPVKPLVEMEAQISDLYRTRLPAIFEKIRPQP